MYMLQNTAVLLTTTNEGHAYIPLTFFALARMGSWQLYQRSQGEIPWNFQSTSGLHLFGWNIGSTGVNVSSAHFD